MSKSFFVNNSLIWNFIFNLENFHIYNIYTNLNRMWQERNLDVCLVRLLRHDWKLICLNGRYIIKWICIFAKFAMSRDIVLIFRTTTAAEWLNRTFLNLLLTKTPWLLQTNAAFAHCQCCICRDSEDFFAEYNICMVQNSHRTSYMHNEEKQWKLIKKIRAPTSLEADKIIIYL